MSTGVRFEIFIRPNLTKICNRILPSKRWGMFVSIFIAYNTLKTDLTDMQM